MEKSKTHTIIIHQQKLDARRIIYYTPAMTQGETLISILLLIIIYFLYHIAKQLSYLTDRKIKISLFKPQQYKSSILPKKTKKQPPEHLLN
jgi:hypothetical protein